MKEMLQLDRLHAQAAQQRREPRQLAGNLVAEIGYGERIGPQLAAARIAGFRRAQHERKQALATNALTAFEDEPVDTSGERERYQQHEAPLESGQSPLIEFTPHAVQRVLGKERRDEAVVAAMAQVDQSVAAIQ